MKKTNQLKKIYIGADHTGYDVKKQIIAYLQSKKYQVEDLGGDSPTAPDDYPDFAFSIGTNVSKNKKSVGIAICGTGVGICIASNKIKGIRAALVYDSKIADLAVRHDNANVLCLAARVTNIKEMFAIIDTFLASTFEKGRHLRRVNKISKIENNKYVKNKK